MNGKGNIIGILIDAVDYKSAVDRIVQGAHERRPMAISALAVHGLMTGVMDKEQKYRLNHFDLLVPDGQPVRWALNLLYRTQLQDRVYGPNLTKAVCTRAARDGVPVYFYGSTPDVLNGLRRSLLKTCPELKIAGMEPSRFRRLTPEEKTELVERIRLSQAGLLFVGLGCPRQEVFAYEFQGLVSMPILAVGAAFPFLAGLTPQAPLWMQNAGLEWLFRLKTDPRRLWRRYIYLNTAYICLLAVQTLGLSRFSTDGELPKSELLYG